MSIEFALTPERRWDMSVGDYLRGARAGGFRTVTLRDVQATSDTAGVLDELGMRCFEVLSMRMNGSVGLAEQARALALAAAAVRAEWICVGGFRDQIAGDTVTALRRASAVAAEAGARLALEFTPFGSLTSLAAAVALVDAVDDGRSGVIVDVWHYFHGDSTWDQLATVPLERIAYVQFSDALPPASDNAGDETLNRRALPGEGVLELDRFASTLLDRGWSGIVSVEVFNRELRELPVAEFARRAYESTARFWA